MNDEPERVILFFPAPDAWERWLEKNGATSSAVWLKFAKKGSGIASLSYDEALESALCHGWIDGQKASFDDRHYLLRFSRRSRKSKWSQINREKAIRLEAEGRMQSPGLKEVEAAKTDGRWEDAYASQSRIEVPEDFQKRLDQRPEALAVFTTLKSSERYSILYRLHHAKKPETRERLIEKYLESLATGQGVR